MTIAGGNPSRMGQNVGEKTVAETAFGEWEG